MKRTKATLKALKQASHLYAQHSTFYAEIDQHLDKVTGTAQQIFTDYGKRLASWFVLISELDGEENYEGCAVVRDCIKVEIEQMLHLVFSYRQDIIESAPHFLGLITRLPATCYAAIYNQ